MIKNPASAKTRQSLFRDIFSSIKVIGEDVLLSSTGGSEEKNYKPAYEALTADFTDSMLFNEAMKLGIDPATVERSRLAEIIYNEMLKQKKNEEVTETRQGC